jgi:predicted secreted hydrolase
MRSVIGFALALTAVVAPAQLDVIDFLGTRPTPGYARALAPRLFSFPADHGPHPDFRSEWWYFTGNLATAGSRHFGFQLAFFRFALAPGSATRASAWATNQAWMAHFALTDTVSRRFLASERFGRGALGIAGAEAQPFRVWLDDWQAVSGDPRSGLFPLRLRASDGPVAIELDLTTRKPLVLQGQDGWDRKGPQPGDASYYYSFTRLAAQGRVRIGEMSHAVTGAAWMDREWSSNALGKDLEGWDWFSIQLSDGSDLMYYRLRRPDGTATPFSSGALILPAGDILELGGDDIRLEVRREWRSPRSQRRYPVAWAIQIPSRGLALEVEPQLDQQELDLTTRYWEGAIRARGTSIGGPVSGQGYLELVGY